MTMARKITEIKHHLNKPTERYECDLVRSGPGHMVLRYVSDREFSSVRLGITFPPELLGYLVHICRDVSISDGEVSYLDMLLDLWFFPDGRHVVLDMDEVEECLEKGILNEEDMQYIEESREVSVAEFVADAQKLNELADALDISVQPK